MNSRGEVEQSSSGMMAHERESECSDVSVSVLASSEEVSELVASDVSTAAVRRFD